MTENGGKPVILITTSTFGIHDPAPLKRLKRAGFKAVLNPFGRRLTEGEVAGLIRESAPVALIAGVEPLTAKVLTNAPGLKVIARCGVGLDSVDLEAAARLGIVVFTTPDGPADSVAELTLGAMLCLLRGLHRSDAGIRSGTWARPMGGLLSGKTVGIIGFGRVGYRVAGFLSPFGCRVQVCDARPLTSLPSGCSQVGLAELLKASNIVTLHLPFSPESRYLMNNERLQAMKKGAFLINTSRGGLVDEEALFHALDSGHLAGAALDTFEEEPYAGPLVGMETVLLTAHIGSYAREGRVRMEARAVDGVLEFLGGS